MKKNILPIDHKNIFVQKADPQNVTTSQHTLLAIHFNKRADKISTAFGSLNSVLNQLLGRIYFILLSSS